jgi:outer membrane autotransporter protein
MKTSPRTTRSSALCPPSSALRPLSSVFCPLVAALCLLAPGNLDADDVYWTASGGNWLTDSWYDAATSGSPVSAPNDADTALINGEVTLAGSAITNFGILGMDAGDLGIVNIVSGGNWQIANTGAGLRIGDAGDSLLNIASGGILANSGTAFFGFQVGSSGTAIISGLWQSTGALYVGNAGVGTLIIENSGTVISAESSRVGFDSTGTGAVIVRGYWSNTSTLVIGGTGKGTLDIDSTGKLITGNFYAADYDGAEAKITVAGLMQSAQAVIGQRGTATTDIVNGGTMSTISNINLGNTANGVGIINVKNGGYLFSSSGQIRVGVTASGTGILNIESGATARAATGVYASTANGYGVINIATGGTLIIDANALYIGNSGTANSAAYGEVNVDGYVQSGGNGTYYTPVGYSGTGIVNVGPTGLIRSGQLDVGREWTSSGTVRIAGRWETTATGSTQDAFVGHAGQGAVIIESGGYLSSISQRYFYVGSGIILSNTSIGGVGSGSMSVGIGSMLIEEGGTFIRRNSYNDMIIAGDASLNNQNRASGTVTVNGLLDIDRYIRIGGNNGGGELYVGQSGTLYAGGLRVTYSDPRATAKIIVDGEMYLRTISSAITAANAYIIVAHYGNSYMQVTQTGTVSATGYISVGQGDFWNNAAVPSDYLTAYSGTLRVDGYMYSGNYIRIGNRLKGVLDLTSTGTMISANYFRMNENNLLVTSTANVAGYLRANTIIDIGYNADTSAHLNIMDGGQVIAGTSFTNGRVATAVGLVTIADSGTLTVGTTFSQNSLSTLQVTLNNRPSTSPSINVGGAATLSGTLLAYVSGSAAASIAYTGGGEGKATDLSGIPILRAAGGISGDFTTVDVIGVTIPPGLPDYIRGGGMKVNEGGPVDTRYDVGFGLAWKSGSNDAHGDFTVEEGKTFDVNVQLADRLISAFSTGWDGKSIYKKGPGTLILSVENTYTGDTIVESGTLRFTGPIQHALGTLVNNGVIDFYETDANNARIGGYRTLSASSLAGNNGVFRMGIDLSTGASDHLIIAGDASGAHRLLITGTAATKPKGNEPMPALVSIGGVNDTDFTADGTIIDGNTSISIDGNFDYGLFKYEVQMLGNRVVIVNTGLDPNVFAQIRGVGAQSLLWFDQLGNISSHLGELRAPRDGGSGFDIWARGHASGASIGGGTSDMPISNVDIWGAEIGSDHTWKFDEQRATAGIYIGTGNASQKFKRPSDALSDSTGESDMLGIGVYGSWLTESGWFANATASMSQYKNSFDSVDGSNNHTTADYKDHGFGVTAEGGHRFAVSSNGWFIEPSIQGAIARLTRASYVTTGNHELNVNSSDSTINRLRGAFRVGRAWQTSAGWMEIAGRIAATRERSSGGEIVISSSPANRWRPNLDGNRYEAGVSYFWQPFERGQLYFDYEYSGGDNFEKPWAISLGLRLSL